MCWVQGEAMWECSGDSPVPCRDIFPSRWQERGQCSVTMAMAVQGCWGHNCDLAEVLGSCWTSPVLILG